MLSRPLARFLSSIQQSFLTSSQIDSYYKHGFLIVRDALPQHIKANLQNWVTELQSLPETPGKWMKYFEVDKATNQRLLCRIENFLPFYPALHDVSYGLIKEMAFQLFGEEGVIYKER